MKYFAVMVTSKSYDISPTMFMEKCSDEFSNVEFVNNIENSFNKLFPKTNIEVKSLTKVSIFDFIKHKDVTFVTAGKLIDLKIKKHKCKKKKRFL